MATFQCTHTFRVPPDRFVLSGHVLSGKIKAGMCVLCTLNSYTVITFEIVAVELVKNSDSATVGLVFRADGEDCDDLFELLDSPGEAFEVE